MSAQPPRTKSWPHHSGSRPPEGGGEIKPRPKDKILAPSLRLQTPRGGRGSKAQEHKQASSSSRVLRMGAGHHLCLSWNFPAPHFPILLWTRTGQVRGSLPSGHH